MTFQINSPDKEGSNYRVMFRLFQMPCCSQLLCWVNPRFPNYCPECGKHVFADLRSEAFTLEHAEGWLRTEPKK